MQTKTRVRYQITHVWMAIIRGPETASAAVHQYLNPSTVSLEQNFKLWYVKLLMSLYNAFCISMWSFLLLWSSLHCWVSIKCFISTSLEPYILFKDRIIIIAFHCQYTYSDVKITCVTGSKRILPSTVRRCQCRKWLLILWFLLQLFFWEYFLTVVNSI